MRKLVLHSLLAGSLGVALTLDWLYTGQPAPSDSRIVLRLGGSGPLSVPEQPPWDTGAASGASSPARRHQDANQVGPEASTRQNSHRANRPPSPKRGAPDLSTDRPSSPAHDRHKPPGSPNVKADSPVTHRVRAGETLSEIAKRYLGSSEDWKRLADHNGIDQPKKMAVGTILTIPAHAQ